MPALRAYLFSVAVSARAEPGDVRAAFLGVHVVGEGEHVLGEHGVLILQRDLDDVAVDLPLDVHRLQVDDVAVGVEIPDERLDPPSKWNVYGVDRRARRRAGW